MARFAKDTVLLGLTGEIAADEEIPASYSNSLGETEKTDFDRLEDLGVVHPDGYEPDDSDQDLDALDADGLGGLKRDVLDAYALELGVDEPDKLPNKGAVVDAILAAREE